MVNGAGLTEIAKERFQSPDEDSLDFYSLAG